MVVYRMSKTRIRVRVNYRGYPKHLGHNKKLGRVVVTQTLVFVECKRERQTELVTLVVILQLHMQHFETLDPNVMTHDFFHSTLGQKSFDCHDSKVPIPHG